MKRFISLGILAVAIAACADTAIDDSTASETFATASSDTAPLRVVGQTIINGSAPDQPYHDAVVSLSIVKGGSQYICSGTVIAPDVVLTAAHCLDGANGGPRFRLIDPSAVQVRLGDSFFAPAATFAVTETLIHPGYDRRALENDIGILRTGSTIPVAPVPALPAALGLTSADIGATINFAGFGLDENDDLGVKLQVDGTIDALGCNVSGCPNFPYDTTATQFSYDQASGPCSGDSGGPAFIFRGGVPYVGGITSYGDSGCAVYGASTRADAYDAWITSFIGAAPVCGDGVCNGAEDCSTCAGDCGACPFCGDGVCNGDEDCGTCAGDCGACPFCGDGVCDPSESCQDCAADCGDCPACGLAGDACTTDSDCCFEKCRGSRAGKVCR